MTAQNTDDICTDREHDLSAADLFLFEKDTWVDEYRVSGSGWKVTEAELIPEKYTRKDEPHVRLNLLFEDGNNLIESDKEGHQFEIIARTKQGNIETELYEVYFDEDGEYVSESLGSYTAFNSQTERPVEEVASAMSDLLKMFNRNILH